MSNLYFAEKINKRVIVVYISKDNTKFIGRDKQKNYYKGLVQDLTTVQ